MSELVDACRAWCALTDERPFPLDRNHTGAWWVKRAIRECPVEFSELNSMQRRLIAGWGDDGDEARGSTDTD